MKTTLQERGFTNFYVNKLIYPDTCTIDKNREDYILPKLCNDKATVCIICISKNVYISYDTILI